MRVYDIMDSRIATVSANDYAAEALRLMTLGRRAWIFVLDCKELIGIAYASDMERLSESLLREQDVREHLKTNLLAIDPEADTKEAERLLRTGRRDFLTVVKDGCPIGIITRDSLTRSGSRSGKAVSLQAS